MIDKLQKKSETNKKIIEDIMILEKGSGLYVRHGWFRKRRRLVK